MSLVRYRLNRDSVEPTLITTCSHRHQLATVAQAAAAAAAAIGRLITNGARYLLVPSSSSCQLLVGQIRARSIKLVGAARCSRNGRQFGNNSNHKSATLTSKPLLVGNSIYQGPKKATSRRLATRRDRCTCCSLGAHNDNANLDCRPGTSRAPISRSDGKCVMCRPFISTAYPLMSPLTFANTYSRQTCGGSTTRKATPSVYLGLLAAK